MSSILLWTLARSAIPLLMMAVGFYIAIKKVEDKMEKIILISIFTILFLAALSVNYWVERENSDKWEQLIQTVYDATVQRELDTKDIEEIIALKYKEIFKSSEEDAKKLAESLSMPEKLADRESIKKRGEELGIKYLLKWKPLYDFFLKEFDERIHELEKKDMIKSFNKYEEEVISIEKTTKFVTIIREVIFSNGTKIKVYLMPPGEIKNGKLIKRPNIRCNEEINDNSYQLFYILFRDDATSLRIDYQEAASFLTTKKDPLLDEEFRNKLTEAISHSIELVYLDDAKRH